MTEVTIYLLHGTRLQREGVRQLLSAHPVEIVGDSCKLDDLRRDLASGRAPDCVLLDVDQAEDVRALVAEVGALVPPPQRLVALAGEITEPLLWQVAESGADGLLDKNGCAETMVNALCLIRLGQKVFPTALLLDRLAALMAEPALAAPKLEDTPLSPREVEVLRYLAVGHANKAIAERLGIAQATVKNHLQRIQDKLKVGNRTQAAIWALQHDLLASAAAPEPKQANTSAKPSPASPAHKAPVPRPGGQAEDHWSRLAASLSR